MQPQGNEPLALLTQDSNTLGQVSILFISFCRKNPYEYKTYPDFVWIKCHPKYRTNLTLQ
jgi:hypothetical protein